MKLIVGLGNIGPKYTFTRHNAGFMLADSIALNENLTFRENSRLKCFMTNLVTGTNDYLIIKPTTFMNLSGEAVRAVVDYYKIDIKDILIVYDDISLELGKIRFRANGSDGGHNGIKSIIQSIGTDKFDRLKVGVGPVPEHIPIDSFVLSNFTPDELKNISKMGKIAVDVVDCWFREGIEKTQNKYNKIVI